MVIWAGLLATSTAQALVGGDEVVLVGTTVPGLAAHVHGALEITAPGTLLFKAHGKPEFAMPYEKIFEFGLTDEDAFHLGFFPAMFFGMVAPRPKRHTFTVSWHDENGTGQEASFEISLAMSRRLLPVMYARARQACVRREFGACTPVVPAPPPPRVPLAPPAAIQQAPKAPEPEPAPSVNGAAVPVP